MESRKLVGLGCISTSRRDEWTLWTLAGLLEFAPKRGLDLQEICNLGSIKYPKMTRFPKDFISPGHLHWMSAMINSLSGVLFYQKCSDDWLNELTVYLRCLVWWKMWLSSTLQRLIIRTWSFIPFISPWLIAACNLLMSYYLNVHHMHHMAIKKISLSLSLPVNFNATSVSSYWASIGWNLELRLVLWAKFGNDASTALYSTVQHNTMPWKTRLS